MDLANRYPIFTFPSQTVKNGERQAAIIETDDAYFEKNVLGLSIFITVEFTDKIQHRRRQKDSCRTNQEKRPVARRNTDHQNDR